ncbi:FAD-linked oxidoreductase [Diaporthe eres]|nr:FAD-linked oxidoreductase [Diaporthe eres]
MQARSTSDVQNAIRLAERAQYPPRRPDDGATTSWARSDAGSGLLVDLLLFNGVKVLESFTAAEEGQVFVEPDTEVNVVRPKDGVRAAVAFGPASAGLRLNHALGESGLFSVSGAAATVALGGGWGQDGGYGPLTARYGLGVDQRLEAMVFTPDGELRVANKITNPDLFWAVRGGGPFGAVVKATRKAYPTVPHDGVQMASVTEENWAESFWGNNDPRLSEVKRWLGLIMTFSVSPGINAHHVQAVGDARPSLPSRPREAQPVPFRDGTPAPG